MIVCVWYSFTYNNFNKWTLSICFTLKYLCFVWYLFFSFYCVALPSETLVKEQSDQSIITDILWLIVLILIISYSYINVIQYNSIKGSTKYYFNI